MRVVVTRSGGVAGLTRRWSLHVAEGSEGHRLATAAVAAMSTTMPTTLPTMPTTTLPTTALPTTSPTAAPTPSPPEAPTAAPTPNPPASPPEAPAVAPTPSSTPSPAASPAAAPGSGRPVPDGFDYELELDGERCAGPEHALPEPVRALLRHVVACGESLPPGG